MKREKKKKEILWYSVKEIVISVEIYKIIIGDWWRINLITNRNIFIYL